MLNHALHIYFCGQEACSPRHSFGPAVRNHYLMHVILKGKGEFHVHGQIFHLKKGDAFLISPDQSTYYVADQENPWEYAWVAFDGYEVSQILESCGFTDENPVFHFQDAEEESELGGHVMFENILTLVVQYNHSGRCTLETLGYLYLIFGFMQRSAGAQEKSYERDYLRKACDYVSQNYSYQIKVLDIARYIGIDRTYLYKLFRKELELSPQEYLISFRIKTAKNMLKHTTLTVTEVSYSCGFHDSASFCKCFKRLTGYTPKNYRKSKEAYDLA